MTFVARNREKKSQYSHYLILDKFWSSYLARFYENTRHRKGGKIRVYCNTFQVMTPKKSKNHTVGWILVDKFFGLRDVEKKISVFVVSSKILLFHQTVDSLLDTRHFGYEVPSNGLNCFEFYLLVRKLFSCFHYSHNRRVDVMLPVALNRTLRALRLLGLRRKGGGCKHVQRGALEGMGRALTVSFT